MSIDKMLSPDVIAAEDIEIVIDIPEDIEEIEDDTEEDFDINLAENMDDGDLDSIANELLSDYADDLASRKDWIQTYVDGLELLGLKIEERTEPWEGACGVFHPMLAEALVKFQAETMMSTFPAAGPVKTKVIGKSTPAKKEAAERVREDMNHQLTDEMPEFRPEHERMLWGLGLAGNAFKKVYFDPNMQRQTSMYVPAEDIVVPYGASDLASSPRVTHVMRKTKNDLKKLQIAGFYRDLDLGDPNNILDEVEKKIAEKLGFRATSDDRYKLLEMQVELDLPGYEHEDGLKLPYIVTIEKGSSEVLSIRRNWQPDDESYTKRSHLVHYGYIPGFGFYCFGLIHLIGAYAKSGTSLLRQLVDAGTLSNLPGGFKSRGMRVKGDDTPIGPGEWRDVDIASGTLKDNLLPLPYKEPSQTLAGLMDKIIEEGRRFANTADLQISDMSSQSPVGTTLAILERTLKTMSAIQARIHYSMKQELVLLRDIIRDYTPDEYPYEPETGKRFAKKSDYDDADVIPVSDPNAATMAQKIVQYQAVFQLAQQSPQLYNMPLLHRNMLEVLGVKDADRLVPMDEDQKPLDPVSENQNVLMMKPVKAFQHQDHQSHIVVHMSAMQDPKIMQLLQNNPMAQQLSASMMAHINEHLGFEYRKQIEQALGFSLPAQKDELGEDIPMDPQVEAQLAPVLAQAAQRLLSHNQQEVTQQKAQQQAQDPLVQMQMQELQLKAQEQERKAAKDQTDAALKQEQIQVERERIAALKEAEDQRVKAGLLKTAAEMSNNKTSQAITLGADLLKHMSSQHQEAQLRSMQQRHEEMQAKAQQTKAPVKKDRA
jgi:hypothetical protein